MATLRMTSTNKHTEDTKSSIYVVDSFALLSSGLLNPTAFVRTDAEAINNVTTRQLAVMYRSPKLDCTRRGSGSVFAALLAVLVKNVWTGGIL